MSRWTSIRRVGPRHSQHIGKPIIAYHSHKLIQIPDSVQHEEDVSTGCRFRGKRRNLGRSHLSFLR